MPKAKSLIQQSFSERKVRSLSLFEENTSFVSELIPSWQGPMRAATCQAPERKDENEIVHNMPDQDLAELRKALRDLGGKKVQQESPYTAVDLRAPSHKGRNVRCLCNRNRAAVTSYVQIMTMQLRLTVQYCDVLTVWPLQGAEVHIQERVFADVMSVRERHRHDTVARYLHLSRVHHHKVMAEYGTVSILDSIQFFNPSSEAQTFRLVVWTSPPAVSSRASQ